MGIMDHLLSSGSGRGRLAFFDMRANDYISVQPEPLSCPQSPEAQNTHDDDADEYSDDSLDDLDMAAEVEGRHQRDWYYHPSHAHMGYAPPALSWRQQLPDLPGDSARRSCFLQAGSGWLDHNHVYL